MQKLLNENKDYDDTYDLHQLNTRWHHNEYWHMNFDGLESYLLTNRGARILLNTTHNREHFNGKVISVHLGNIKNLHLKSVGYLVRMKLKIGQNKISFRVRLINLLDFVQIRLFMKAKD